MSIETAPLAAPGRALHIEDAHHAVYCVCVPDLQGPIIATRCKRLTSANKYRMEHQQTSRHFAMYTVRQS